MAELVAVLQEANVDGLLLYSNGMHSISRPTALQQLAGVTPISDNNALIVTESGEEVFIVDYPPDVERIKRHTGYNDVRGTSSFVDELKTVFEEHNISSVGISGSDRISYPIYQSIRGLLHRTEIVDEAVDRVASQKTTTDLETFRQLGSIADKGFKAAFEAVKPGLKEYELAAEIEKAMFEAGSEDNFNLLGSGPHNNLMHAPTDRVIRDGDVLLFEISPSIDGLVVQICRTISVGTPNPALINKYALLQEALQSAERRIKPGAPASVIAESMNEVLRAAGYEQYCQPPYMRTRGHEFGVGPIGMAIDEESTTPLKEEMILVIHPNQYIPETGYLALGNPIEITADGFTSLTSVDARLFTKEVF